jgi:hypothetical protein
MATDFLKLKSSTHPPTFRKILGVGALGASGALGALGVAAARTHTHIDPLDAFPVVTSAAQMFPPRYPPLLPPRYAKLVQTGSLVALGLDLY